MPFFIALVTVGQLAAVTDGICGLVAVYQIWGARAATWAIVCLGAYCLCGVSSRLVRPLPDGPSIYTAHTARRLCGSPAHVARPR